jgi:hypothetical protein
VSSNCRDARRKSEDFAFPPVTKLNFGGVPNFERSGKNARVDQSLVVLPQRTWAKIRAKSLSGGLALAMSDLLSGEWRRSHDGQS